MRFTIERLRTLVLLAGVLLVAALAVFLTIGRWKSLLGMKDIPKRLGLNIEQEANGFVRAEFHAGHAVFRIEASKADQFRDGKVLLHHVMIEMYGQDGKPTDRIEGNEFEYNQQTGIAKAEGKAEITIMRPTEPLAGVPPAAAAKADKGKPRTGPLAQAARSAEESAIHVETSGLTFDKTTGVASTSQHVAFSMAKGSGSAMGASYNSQGGELVLDHAVELTTARGGQPVVIHAAHAEFGRNDQLCTLLHATATYRQGQATAEQARILFRRDGTAQQVDAERGLTVATATGSHLSAPTGTIAFDAHNQPRHGDLEGGVTIDSVTANRQLHGTGPSAVLHFSPQGDLERVQMNHGVELESESASGASGAQTAQMRVTRTWRSPLADVAFRKDGAGQVEPATIYGSGGVVVTTETRRGSAAPVPSRLTADEITGEFGPGSELTAMTGTGHASIEQTTAKGARQTMTGDRLEALFEPPQRSTTRGASSTAAEIQSATLEGDVVLAQQPAPKPGAPPQAELRATAGRAEYEGGGEWVHLSEAPHVEDGDFALAATKIDISQQSGDAFARGAVRATWSESAAAAGQGRQGSGNRTTNDKTFNLGGQGPAHAIADEAQFNQASGEATFRGHARLWQQANSIAGPLIVLNRQRRTLVSDSTNPAEPVRAVLLSAGPAPALTEPEIETVHATQKPAHRPSHTPTVIRVRGGEFTYSDSERRAVMAGGALGPVIAETGDATCTANEVTLILAPEGKQHESERGQGQVERMTASGDVVIRSQGRRGAGAQLVYTGATGEYVLTGTPSAPPRLTDPARGTVAGAALIFNSRNDSVSIEGGGRETSTDTTVPKIGVQESQQRKWRR